MFFSKKKRERQREAEEQKVLIERIRNRKVLYVANRDEDGETIICREAVINIVDDRNIIIHSENRIVLQMRLEDVKLGELMSLGGTTIVGKDIDGKEISLVAYYTSDIQREI